MHGCVCGRCGHTSDHSFKRPRLHIGSFPGSKMWQIFVNHAFHS